MVTKAVTDGLGKRLHGAMILPGDERYEEARRVWNGLIDRRPAIIVQCADDSDVVHAVRFARNRDLPVAVRGGGHNVAGFGTCNDGLVIDLCRMRATAVDPQQRLARAQGGATWGELDERTQAHALATTGGLVSTTGIGGFTLGGGIGWLMRKHGLTIDNLVAVDLVTADGMRVTATEAENPDLFWGVRGGGGNFGVITSFTYRLHQLGPYVYGGVAFYPMLRVRHILRFYREWVRTLPNELTTMVAFLSAPSASFIPEDVRGTRMMAIGVCHAGPIDEGEALVKPLRHFAPPEIDLMGPTPYTTLQTLFDSGAPKGVLAYWKTEHLHALDDRAVDLLVEHVGDMGAPLAQVHVHHVGGAVGGVSAGATAFGQRMARFILNIVGMWTDPDESGRHIAWARELAAAVRPLSTGAPFLNFLGDEGEGRVRAAYGADKFARLVSLKNKYDPYNVFRLNQNIRPSV